MKAKILILEDEPRMRRLLKLVLQEENYEVHTADDGREGILLWKKWAPDLVLSDLKMPNMDGLEVLRWRNSNFPNIPLVLLTAFGTVETAVAAMKAGACDYLTKPVDHQQLRELVHRMLEEHSSSEPEQQPMLGSCAAIQTLRREISLAAATESSVLITGESGTGKELAARAVHEASGKKSAPFIRVNCPAIPGELLESELFGHLQGSFTGAVRDRQGAFVAADGGTLFLDEIGDLPLSLQPKLLYAVEQKEITPVGATTSKKIRVKIIAATNRNLVEMVANGSFRQDLFYRLNTLSLHLPPLRERKEDIETLACRFIKDFCAGQGRTTIQPDEKVLARLQAYDWPGNVRELRNVIEWGCLHAAGDRLTRINLPELSAQRENNSTQTTAPDSGFNLVDHERTLILTALEQCYWNQTRAARRLGITRNTLRYRIKKYGIRRS